VGKLTERVPHRWSAQTDQKVFSIQWPGKIVFGSGELRRLGDEARILGQRALLVTTPELSALGLAEQTQKILETAGVSSVRFDRVKPDPTCEAVEEASQIAREASCDVVIGLGGGSAIDLAKGVAVGASHQGPIWEYVTYTGANAKPVQPSVLPVIAVPTTAGTGSEVSNGAVLHNESLHMKAALLSPHVFPRVALVDPALSLTMPPLTTAMTGFDALTHGIESYLNAVRSNPASDMMALETVRKIARYLPLVIINGQDLVARGHVSWGATLGGMSIALSNASVAHAMALPLSARLGTAHGLALSRLQPVVVEHSIEAQPERCAELADAAGAAVAGMNTTEKAHAFASWLREFVDRIGLSKARAPEVTDEGLYDSLAEDVLRYMGRPVQQHRPVFTRMEIRQMFTEALAPARH
jgi:alcohol dehydrogenase class IV